MYNERLPLIDLHRHLDGNIRPETVWDLANKHGIALPTTQFNEFIKLATIQDKASNLVEFLTKLDYGVSVLKTLDDVQRISYENIEDLATAGIDYAELRFSPYYMAMAFNLPLEGLIEAIIDGVQQGIKTFDTKANLIGILSRSYGQQACSKELNALLQYKHNLVAIDLAGDEKGFHGELFEEHFQKVQQNDLAITIHAGEALGAESVWHAVDKLGAKRIGHGVNSIEDPRLIEHLAKNSIAIESCLTSNYQTGTVNNLQNHPIKQFLNAGLKVCLNTDDPAVEKTELKQEFAIAHNVVGLSIDEITTLQQNAINACFISDHEKQQLRTIKQT